MENQFPPSSWWIAFLHWICKTPEAELPIPSGSIHWGWIEEFSDPHLCIFLLSGNGENIQRHLRGNQSQLQLLFYVQAMGEDNESGESGMLNISKCGCRVLCKEDLELWGKSLSEQKQSNDIDEMASSSVNKSRIEELAGDNQCCDGFEVEYTNTSNAEAKRRKLG